MKNFWRGFLALTLICVFALSGCGARFSRKSAEPFDVTPPFYKVSDGDTGAVVYLLGTMHVGKEGAVYPQEIYKALDESDVFVTEVDVLELSADKSKVRRAMEVLLCEDGKTAADYMGEDYSDITRTFKSIGLYNANFDKYLPASWSTRYSNYMSRECGYSSEYGTDRVMLSYAKKAGKPIEEMETAEEQYQIDANASIEFQMYNLNTALDRSYEDTKAQLDKLYDAWKTFDEDALAAPVAAAPSELPEELKDDYSDFYNAMYAKRQEKMSAYILEKLKNGEKAFVTVGALHFIAPPSIIEQLEENGYTAEKAVGQ